MPWKEINWALDVLGKMGGDGRISQVYPDQGRRPCWPCGFANATRFANAWSACGEPRCALASQFKPLQYRYFPANQCFLSIVFLTMFFALCTQFPGCLASTWHWAISPQASKPTAWQPTSFFIHSTVRYLMFLRKNQHVECIVDTAIVRFFLNKAENLEWCVNSRDGLFAGHGHLEGLMLTSLVCKTSGFLVTSVVNKPMMGLGVWSRTFAVLQYFLCTFNLLRKRRCGGRDGR